MAQNNLFIAISFMAKLCDMSLTENACDNAQTTITSFNIFYNTSFNLETTMTSGNDIALIRLPNLAITSHEDSKQVDAKLEIIPFHPT